MQMCHLPIYTERTWEKTLITADVHNNNQQNTGSASLFKKWFWQLTQIITFLHIFYVVWLTVRDSLRVAIPSPKGETFHLGGREGKVRLHVGYGRDDKYLIYKIKLPTSTTLVNFTCLHKCRSHHSKLGTPLVGLQAQYLQIISIFYIRARHTWQT